MKSALPTVIFTVIIYLCSICICPTVSGPVHTCRSYGGQNGQCVDLRRCPPLLAVILSKEKTAEHIRILQQLTCLPESTSSSEPVVCCPDGEIVSSSYIQKDILQEETSPTRRTTPSYPSTTDRSYTNGRISPTITPPPMVVLPHRGRTTTTTEKPSQPREGSTAEEKLFLRMKFMNLMPSLANCSLSDITGRRIIGGTDADHGQFPWMARLGYKNLKSGKVEYYCGGVIINNRYILTAAHCTYGYDDNFDLVHVRLGEHNTKVLTDCSSELGSCSIPENVAVEKVITHPDYNTKTKHNDIALVRVKRDIGFQTYFIKPVCLPFLKEYGVEEPKTLNTFTGTVAGWGRTNWTRSEGSEILQYVHLPIIPSDKCVRDFRNRVNITPEQLCAGGERNQDSCGGDSGGPLMIDMVVGKRGEYSIRRKFQYGIVSFGPVKCGIGIPGVYTRVTEYLPWILKNIER